MPSGRCWPRVSAISSSSSKRRRRGWFRRTKWGPPWIWWPAELADIDRVDGSATTDEAALRELSASAQAFASSLQSATEFPSAGLQRQQSGARHERPARGRESLGSAGGAAKDRAPQGA